MLVVDLFVPFFSLHFLFISAGASASASCAARGRDSSLEGVENVMAAASSREASASAEKTYLAQLPACIELGASSVKEEGDVVVDGGSSPGYDISTE
jgi:hypothetical protein